MLLPSYPSSPKKAFNRSLKIYQRQQTYYRMLKKTYPGENVLREIFTRCDSEIVQKLFKDAIRKLYSKHVYMYFLLFCIHNHVHQTQVYGM